MQKKFHTMKKQERIQMVMNLNKSWKYLQIQEIFDLQ